MTWCASFFIPSRDVNTVFVHDEGVVQDPEAQMLWNIVTHSLSTGWTRSRQPCFSKPVTTFVNPITPIWKPVSLMLWMSFDCTPYSAIVSATQVNHGLITAECYCSLLCLSFDRLKAILSVFWCATKCVAQCLLKGSPLRTLSRPILSPPGTSEFPPRSSRGSGPHQNNVGSELGWSHVASYIIPLGSCRP
jgi:hypothetical protein